ncbi:MAG: hypothetical protein NC310_00350 [Roseburia sp.]|nr:hypothetical protein [Anaeroplasma bactoclasticum]MCM1195503.1 hypothetical protein [Roseburia sp.]MCM1556881.1 hypothetical protein [Anaeroplasma bactoclasticum]
MEKLIDWIIETLSKDGINAKNLVKTTLEEMTIDEWYELRNEANAKIVELRSKGYKPENNPNIMLLKSYQTEVYQCQLLQREIDVLSNFVKDAGITGMPYVPPKAANPVELQHIRLLEAKHKLENLLGSRGCNLEKCMKLLEHVKDPRGKYILTSIFLEGKTQYQIQEAAPFELSYKQLYRLKKVALDDIRKIQSEDL